MTLGLASEKATRAERSVRSQRATRAKIEHRRPTRQIARAEWPIGPKRAERTSRSQVRDAGQQTLVLAGAGGRLREEQEGGREIHGLEGEGLQNGRRSERGCRRSACRDRGGDPCDGRQTP
jgi:hypothetical protein